MIQLVTAAIAALTPPADTTSLLSRRAVLLSGGSCCAFGLPLAASADNPFALAAPTRDGLQAKWLESVRIFLQDSDDDLKYGGELAPGGPPNAVPALQLIPIVQMQKTLQKLAPSIADQSKWDSIYLVVSTGPFATLEFKKIFNAYSDNIYYSSSTAEANAYLLGGATPSTSQTTQYLLRNEALKQLGELRDELKYQQSLPTEKREYDVLDEAMQACLKCFAEYLALSPPAEVKLARDAVYGEGKES